MVEGLGKTGAVMSKDGKLFDSGGINYYDSANWK